MKLLSVLTYIYLLFKPYYIFKSGSIQISDVFLLLGFIVLLMLKRKKNMIGHILNKNKLYVIFLLFVVFINLIYFVIFEESKYILSCLYFLFNLLAIVIFSFLFSENKNFPEKMKRIFKINIVIQLLFYFTSIGRWYDSSRYMGTFNDPNQFGYYILLSIFFIYIISVYDKEKKWNVFYYLMAAFLIIKSSSTGMFVGLLVMIVLYIIENRKRIFYFFTKNIIVIIISLFAVSAGLFAISDGNKLFFTESFSKINVMDRLFQKMERVENISSNDGYNILQERGLDHLYIYPQYMLYGAGEGNYARFELVSHECEIHSTLPAILFYYGIVPFLLIACWIYKRTYKLNKHYMPVYLAIIFESFTLLNYRQSLFWVVFVFSEFIIEKGEKNEN